MDISYESLVDDVTDYIRRLNLRVRDILVMHVYLHGGENFSGYLIVYHILNYVFMTIPLLF